MAKCEYAGIKVGDTTITLKAEVYHWPDEQNQYQFHWDGMDQAFIEALSSVLNADEYRLVMDEIAKEMIEQYKDQKERDVR